MTALFQITLLLVCLTSSYAFSNPCRQESNKTKQFLPHPESKTKYIQCTKRGEMFIFECQTDFEWDANSSKCVKLDQDVRPLIFKSKSRNLNAKIKTSRLNPIVTTTTQAIPTELMTTTTTTMISSTTSTTTQPVFNAELTTISNLINDLEDRVIMKKMRQEVPNKREQELLLNQIKKQEQFIQQSLAVQGEIARQQKLDDEIKLKQQIEQQKNILKQKFIQINPNLDKNVLNSSANEIQNMIHQHEKNEQFRQLNTQRMQQLELINNKKLTDQQHMDDQMIIQQILNFNHLDNLQGALHNRQ